LRAHAEKAKPWDKEENAKDEVGEEF